jgi:hypothetical protein
MFREKVPFVALILEEYYLGTYSEKDMSLYWLCPIGKNIQQAGFPDGHPL